VSGHSSLNPQPPTEKTMNILLNFLRTFLCLSSCVVGPDDAAEPTRTGKTKNHRVWEKFSWPTSFLVLGTTLWAPSLQADEPTPQRQVYQHCYEKERRGKAFRRTSSGETIWRTPSVSIIENRDLLVTLFHTSPEYPIG